MNEQRARRRRAAVALAVLVTIAGCRPHSLTTAPAPEHETAAPGASAKPAEPSRDPVERRTAGPDAGTVVLRSALESFGIAVNDDAALQRECPVDDAGVSIDDLEDAANRRGLKAAQIMVTPPDAIAEHNLPAIAVVRAGAGALDYWLLWRRDGDRVQVMNPRAGNQWMQADDVTRSLYVHEMRVPASREALASPTVVARDGDQVVVRGAVIVTLKR